jgi:AsmA protein
LSFIVFSRNFARLCSHVTKGPQVAAIAQRRMNGEGMRTGLIVGGFVGAAVIVAAAGLGLALAPGWAIGRLAQASQETFGRPVTAQSVRLEFSPSLGLRFDGVSLAGPGPDDGPVLNAAALRLPLSFAALLSHRADFAGASLIEPQLSLTINEMGHVNWPNIAAGSARKIFFENGVLNFSDARTGQGFTLAQIEATADVSESGEVSIKGSAAAESVLLEIDAYVKDVGRISNGGSPAELSLTAPALSLTFSGRAATAGALSLAGTVSIDGPDAREAMAWTGADIPGDGGLKAFSVAGALDSSGRAFAVHGASLQLDNIAAKGELSLDYSKNTPKLSAVLKTSAIHLDPYFPATSFDGSDWSAHPLNLASWRSLDAAIHLEAVDFAAGRLDLGGAVIEATLAKGRLDTSVAAATLPDFKLTLDGSGDVQGIVLGLRSVDPAGLLGALAHLDWLSGAGKLAVSLQATGSSIQEMISTLKGDAQLDMSDGSVQRFDLGRALAAVSRDIQQGWPAHDADRSDFTSLAATFKLADGIASLKPFKVEGARFTMSATGDIDLLRRAVDLRADPRLITGNNGESVGLPVAVVVKGPWDKPKIYPDMANILTNPGAAYADLKGLGLPQLPAANASGN